jgi:hypothetical protein
MTLSFPAMSNIYKSVVWSKFWSIKFLAIINVMLSKKTRELNLCSFVTVKKLVIWWYVNYWPYYTLVSIMPKRKKRKKKQRFHFLIIFSTKRHAHYFHTFFFSSFQMKHESWSKGLDGIECKAKIGKFQVQPFSQRQSE